MPADSCRDEQLPSAHSAGISPVMDLTRVISDFVAVLVADAIILTDTLQQPFDPRRAWIIRQFQDAGAINPRTAQRYFPPSAAHAAAFAVLRERLVIRQATPGHYYLHLRPYVS